MEQQEPRKLFVKNITEFCKPIQLNEIFIKELKNHSNWEYIEVAMNLKDEMAKKVFIFLEFTRERSTCDQMIEILRKSGQEAAAEQLKKFNTSPPFMDISHDIELEITPATVLRSGGSKLFSMDKTPRGMCIIINNVKEELYKESLRFKYMFEKLYFDVEECYNMSAHQIVERLGMLSKEERLKKDNALVIMIISHGYDEKVVGFDGKDLRISTIADIFSEDNCKAMRRKPKLFFFNCCRIKSKNIPVIARQIDNKIVFELESVGQNWINKNKYTLICFSCSEADRSWFIPNNFTYFGQALSHCIAQYACDKSVLQIINLTCERLEQMVNESQTGFNVQISPELRLCKMTRDLYLNPGLPINPSIPKISRPVEYIPKESIPKKSRPEESIPEESIPEESIPEKSIPEESIPEESIPEKSIPEESIPEKSIPEESIPEKSIPEESIPEESIPEKSIPEESIPEKSIPEESIPEESIPEKSRPEGSIPEGSIPEESIPEKRAPKHVSDNQMNVKPDQEVVSKQLEETYTLMEQNSKGICIIINNVNNELNKESLRFKNMFQQFNFDVEECYDMSAHEMEERLQKFSIEKRLEEDITLIVMIISHGHDDTVVGFDGKELEISTIIDIFSEINCNSMQRMRKLFFFNCCRNNSRESAVSRAQPLNNKIEFLLKTDQNEINTKKFTLICFACAEAYKSWFIQNELTYFGQALSHCIEQYAYDKSIKQIMNLTCEKAMQLLAENLEECQVLPRIQLCKTTRTVYSYSTSITCHVSEETNVPSTSKENGPNFPKDKKNLIDCYKLNCESQSRNTQNRHTSNGSEIKAMVNKNLEYYEQKRNDYITQYDLYQHLYGEESNVQKLNIKPLNTLNGEFKIKRGGFGDVVQITDAIDGKLYAVKKIKLKDLDDRHKEYLMREVKINMWLRSEYVVNYVEAYKGDEDFYHIKMEYCYCDLSDLNVKKRKEFYREEFQHMDKIEFYITCELFKEILECVDYLHSKCIIHRDIKPGNILIAENESNGRFVKIGDFGLSVQHELKSKPMIHSNGIGTLSYAAPEALSNRRYGTKSDCYGIGITMRDLFDFDIQELEVTEQELLKDHYNKMKKLCGQLTSNKVAFRPNCKKSMIKMKDWAITLKDLDKEVDFIKLKKDISGDLTIEECFHKFFIKRKLSHKNV